MIAYEPAITSARFWTDGCTVARSSFTRPPPLPSIWKAALPPCCSVAFRATFAPTTADQPPGRPTHVGSKKRLASGNTIGVPAISNVMAAPFERAALTAIVDEGTEGERIIRLPVSFARTNGKVLEKRRFRLDGGALREEAVL